MEQDTDNGSNPGVRGGQPGSSFSTAGGTWDPDGGIAHQERSLRELRREVAAARGALEEQQGALADDVAELTTALPTVLAERVGEIVSRNLVTLAQRMESDVWTAVGSVYDDVDQAVARHAAETSEGVSRTSARAEQLAQRLEAVGASVEALNRRLDEAIHREEAIGASVEALGRRLDEGSERQIAGSMEALQRQGAQLDELAGQVAHLRRALSDTRGAPVAGSDEAPSEPLAGDDDDDAELPGEEQTSGEGAASSRPPPRWSHPGPAWMTEEAAQAARASSREIPWHRRGLTTVIAGTVPVGGFRPSAARPTVSPAGDRAVRDDHPPAQHPPEDEAEGPLGGPLADEGLLDHDAPNDRVDNGTGLLGEVPESEDDTDQAHQGLLGDHQADQPFSEDEAEGPLGGPLADEGLLDHDAPNDRVDNGTGLLGEVPESEDDTD
ncbi:MAG TPA: hypothetical protein VE152_10435, partial [Acidimicrobiales bacterium]|nr:hypothetical protein [Acidimicrobiales bacterium]